MDIDRSGARRPDASRRPIFGLRPGAHRPKFTPFGPWGKCNLSRKWFKWKVLVCEKTLCLLWGNIVWVVNFAKKQETRRAPTQFETSGQQLQHHKMIYQSVLSLRLFPFQGFPTNSMTSVSYLAQFQLHHYTYRFPWLWLSVFILLRRNFFRFLLHVWFFSSKRTWNKNEINIIDLRKTRNHFISEIPSWAKPTF